MGDRSIQEQVADDGWFAFQATALQTDGICKDTLRKISFF
jgi:hypothetical protein